VADYHEHVQAGVVFYGGFLVVGGGLWLMPTGSALRWMEVLLPTGSASWETVIGLGICFVIAMLGALWPDVDIKSMGQLVFYRLFLVLDLGLLVLYYFQRQARYLEGAALLGLAAMLPLIGKHRGWTHSRIVMFGLCGAIAAIPMIIEGGVTWVGLPYAIAALLGYASHLFKDGILFTR